MDASTRALLAVGEAAEHERRARELFAEAGVRLAAAAQLTAEGRQRGFSITRTVDAAARTGLRDGYEREVSEELARRAGTMHDPHRPWIPWSALAQRTLNVGTGSLGGYLVSEPVGQAAQALFPVSTVVRLGAQVLSGLRGDINIPRVTGNATGFWLTELGTATASDLTLGQAACSPKRVGAFTRVSRQLLAQSEAERLVGNHLLAVVGAAIDAAVLAGTSTDASVPLGIRYTAGVTVSTGTSYDNAAAQAQVKVAAAANFVDENIRFIGAPAVRELLAKRASNGTGSQYLWADDRLAGKRAFVNGNAPASTLFCGDYSTIVIPTWGEGLQVEINPYEQFEAGLVGMRVFASVNVAVTQPAGFAVSVGIT